MTYNVFSGTLNPAQSINQPHLPRTLQHWHIKSQLCHKPDVGAMSASNSSTL